MRTDGTEFEKCCAVTDCTCHLPECRQPGHAARRSGICRKDGASKPVGRQVTGRSHRSVSGSVRAQVEDNRLPTKIVAYLRSALEAVIPEIPARESPGRAAMVRLTFQQRQTGSESGPPVLIAGCGRRYADDRLGEQSSHLMPSATTFAQPSGTPTTCRRAPTSARSNTDPSQPISKRPHWPAPTGSR